MRRALLVALVLGSASATPTPAQTPRVSVVIRLYAQAEADGSRKPIVQVRDLLADPRWSQALESSFPVRLTFHLEIWRSRDGWIDEFQRATEWSTVIQHEPLQDQYRVTRIFLSGPEEFRFATRDSLDQWLRAPNLVDAIPAGVGTFYYNLKLSISVLSDEEMEELERFLAGEPSGPASGRGSIGRGLRRFLLRVAGLPSEELEVRSERFRVERK